MDAKRKSLALDSKVPKEPVNSVSQYMWGAIGSEYINHAVSGRCSVFDDVIDPTGSKPCMATPSIVRSGKYLGHCAIPEYLAAICEVEPCRAP